MKLLRVGDKYKEKPAIIDKNEIIRDLSSIINDFNSYTLNNNTLETLKKTDLSKLPIIDKNIRIGACVSNPQKFIGIGLNYTDHAEEQKLPVPREPVIFFKSPSCITGPNDNIQIPKKSKKTDWEVELGLVIGKRTQHISLKESLNCIFGFFLVNDVSEREWQKERCGQWVKGKSADSFGPIGPYIITTDEITNYQNLDMFLDVNGKRMQTGNTNKMIFNVNYIVHYVSQFMTLLPGDIITTGTPQGVGDSMKPPIYLKDGDKVKLGINNLGEQVHDVVS